MSSWIEGEGNGMKSIDSMFGIRQKYSRRVGGRIQLERRFDINYTDGTFSLLLQTSGGDGCSSKNGGNC